MQKVFDHNRVFGDLKSEVNIPDQKKGRFEITHDTIMAGKPITVVSVRNSLFMHYKPLQISLPFDLKVTRLLEHGENEGVWMTDHPQEIFLGHDAYDAAFGDVLIGGLGLGYTAQKIASKPGVKDVIVVEKEKDVIAMVKPHLNKKIQIVQADLFDFLLKKGSAQPGEYFDFCYFDIWASTGESVLPIVNKLRGLVQPLMKKNGVIKCWAEDEMHGQVEHSINTKLLVEKLVKGAKDVKRKRIKQAASSK